MSKNNMYLKNHSVFIEEVMENVIVLRPEN